MATNTSQNVGRSGMGYIAIRTRWVNFKTCHMSLSSSVSHAKSSKNNFISPTACPKQSPSCIVVGDADCCALGPGFESRKRHGCLKMYSAFAAWGYSQ
ncbi:hypothetical protein TNCV_1126341 [Trichonephila clavipes]|nr:hypothetical protein TNCV_1126341 [Trichonephila clavipes]